MSELSPRRRALLLIAGAMAVAAAVLVVNAFTAGLTCGVDTSYCALGGKPHEWRGLVLTADGRPVAGATVRYRFESNRPRGRLVRVVSDAQGRYCLRWPRERITADVSVGANRGQAAVIVSPEAALPVIAGEGGIRVAATPWDPVGDAAAECLVASPPWYRVDDLKENWRYELIKWVSVLALATGLVAAVLPGRLRHRAALVPVMFAGCDVVLFVLVWIVRLL
jgi:hypothetical protein